MVEGGQTCGALIKEAETNQGYLLGFLGYKA